MSNEYYLVWSKFKISGEDPILWIVERRRKFYYCSWRKAKGVWESRGVSKKSKISLPAQGIKSLKDHYVVKPISREEVLLEML